ncbi:MAG TPA: NADH-quinone oxidoreductase subunit K [Roseococcus sp.]|jgi:multisubunit Na+/H+ antiporter MnhC subunit|nr:NADH-quinone oxidoreductase subunit K [Roseococcus sp.]
MEFLLAVLFGVLLAAALYLLMARSLARAILGVLLLGNAANIAIIASGRVLGSGPPLVASGANALAAGASNPLPQALVLTAIVISFGLTAYVMVLSWAVWRGKGTVDTEALRVAEPRGLPAADAREAAAAETLAADLLPTRTGAR